MLARFICLTSLAAMLAALCGTVTADTNRFLESDGRVVMDIESSPLAGDWVLETSVGGFKGSGYYVWRGPNLFNPASAGQGVLRYHFRIQNPGNYQMRWRSRIVHGDNGTESNDSWIRFPTGQNIGGQHGLNGWTKVYMGHLNVWSWDSYTVDHVGKQIRQFFPAGDHVVEISGRSFGHALDRLALYRYEDIEFTAGLFDTFEPSATTSAPQAVAQPAPQPQPEPQPEPQPVNDPAPTPVLISTGPVAPQSLRAEVYSSSAAELFWNPDGGMNNYEIQRDGESVGTTNGSSFFDGGLQGGSTYQYAVIATDQAGLTSEASIVELSTPAGSSPGAEQSSSENTPSPGSSVSGLRVEVYSSSAVELYWDRVDSIDPRFEVSVNGAVVGQSTGNSFYIDQLQPATEYQFSVVSLSTDASGNTVASQATSVSAVTRDGSQAPAATGSQAVPAPENVTIAIYSDSACELFWDAVAPSANVVATEVVRDGVALGNVPGNSFFDDACTSGTAHRYELTAISASGGSSATVVVTQ